MSTRNAGENDCDKLLARRQALRTNRTSPFKLVSSLRVTMIFAGKRTEPNEGSRTQQSGATTELDDVRTLSVDVDEHGEQRKGSGDIVRDVLKVYTVWPRLCD